jgi:two-component system, NtrC family, sensor kinase
VFRGTWAIRSPRSLGPHAWPCAATPKIRLPPEQVGPTSASRIPPHPSLRFPAPLFSPETTGLMQSPATTDADVLVAANRADTLETVLRWLLHDVRTPAQVLTLLPQLLTGDLAPASEWQDTLRQACTHLTWDLRLLDRVLLRPVERRATQPVDLGAALRFVSEVFNARRSQFHAEITAAIDAALPPVCAVAEDLENAMINLVLNAAEAREDEEGRVSFRGSVDRENVLLCLEDDGPGIAETIRDRLFHPFVTTKPNRRGLGLFAARTLLSRFGGEISCEAREPPGTRFVLRLPIWHSRSS